VHQCCPEDSSKCDELKELIKKVCEKLEPPRIEAPKQCDIIMAHGYKEIFASSTLDIPFSFSKIAQQLER
jgi:hypothetical protein